MHCCDAEQVLFLLTIFHIHYCYFSSLYYKAMNHKQIYNHISSRLHKTIIN